MAKDVLKSIRLSQADFDYIDSFPGESFNEKLDNMINLFERELPAKQDELRRINNTIVENHIQLKSLSRQIDDLNELVFRAKRFIKDLQALDFMLESRFESVLADIG